MDDWSKPATIAPVKQSGIHEIPEYPDVSKFIRQRNEISELVEEGVTPVEKRGFLAKLFGSKEAENIAKPSTKINLLKYSPNPPKEEGLLYKFTTAIVGKPAPKLDIGYPPLDNFGVDGSKKPLATLKKVEEAIEKNTIEKSSRTYSSSSYSSSYSAAKDLSFLEKIGEKWHGTGTGAKVLAFAGAVVAVGAFIGATSKNNKKSYTMTLDEDRATANIAALNSGQLGV